MCIRFRPVLRVSILEICVVMLLGVAFGTVMASGWAWAASAVWCEKGMH